MIDDKDDKERGDDWMNVFDTFHSLFRTAKKNQDMKAKNLIGFMGGGGGSPNYIATDFPGLQWWYDESQETTYANNDPMPIEHDFSGNGLDNTAAAANRALYKTNAINGLPAAEFDGSNDAFTPPSKAATNFLHEGDFTLVMVLKSDTDAASKVIFDSVSTTAGLLGMYIRLESSARLRVQIGNGTTSVVNGLTPITSFTKDVYHLLVIKYDQNAGANALTVEVDNVLVLTSPKLANNASGNSASTFFFWGLSGAATQAFDGQMAYRAGWNRVLTDTELTNLIGGIPYL